MGSLFAAHGPPTEAVGISVDRNCPLTFNLMIISDHGCQLAAQTVILDSGQLSGQLQNLNAEKVVGSMLLEHRFSSFLSIKTTQ